MVVELREASDDDVAAARRRWEERHRSWWARQHFSVDDIERRFGLVAKDLEKAIERPVYAVASGDLNVGTVSPSLFERDGGPHGGIDDIWIDPRWRRQGLGAAALRATEAWLVRERSATAAFCTIDPADPAHLTLFADYRVQAQRMAREITEPPKLPSGLSCRPFPESEFETWKVGRIEGYAESISGSGALSPEEARRRAAADFAQLLPQGLTTPDHAFWQLEANGERVAMIWLCHHRESTRSFVYMVEVESRHRGKGYGKAIMRLGEKLTYEAGDTVLALNVFGQNATAIGLYTSLGYTVTDQSRIRDLNSTV